MLYLSIDFLKGAVALELNLNGSSWKRFFSVPCAIVDNYLKLADGPALKLILYLISCENEPEIKAISSATGLSETQIEEAAMFWKQLGVISDGKNPEAPEAPEKAETVTKVVHARYQPKDIAEMLQTDPGMKEMFTEAEATLGRILKHSDHETLISLKDYYGFSEQSIVLILEYCTDLGKTSARYYETVAKSLYENGMTDFHSIEEEFERLKEYHSFENEVKREFGLNVKLTSKQVQFIKSWRDMGFGLDMISLAREKCVDATNSLSFPYINKILLSWKDKDIFTPKAVQNEQKPAKQGSEHSYSLDEFDSFTLVPTGKEKK